MPGPDSASHGAAARIKMAALGVVIALGSLSFAAGAGPGPAEQLREYTKKFDPFDRLAIWPMDHRPAAAIETAIMVTEHLATEEAKGLNDPLEGKARASQKRDLRATAKKLSDIVKSAIAIEAQWNTDLLSLEKKTRLAKLRAVVETFAFGTGDEVDDEEFRTLSVGVRDIAKDSAPR